MDHHLDFDVMAPVLVCRDLQRLSFKGDAVVSDHCSLVLFVQDGVEIYFHPEYKSKTSYHRQLQKFSAKCRLIRLVKIAVGIIYFVNSMRSQLLLGSVLMSAKYLFGPSSALWSIGRDHLSTQVTHVLSEQDELGFSHVTASL